MKIKRVHLPAIVYVGWSQMLYTKFILKIKSLNQYHLVLDCSSFYAPYLTFAILSPLLFALILRNPHKWNVFQSVEQKHMAVVLPAKFCSKGRVLVHDNKGGMRGLALGAELRGQTSFFFSHLLPLNLTLKRCLG